MRKKIMLILFSSSTLVIWSQRVVTGVITAETDKEPVIGAIVKGEKSNAVAISDLSGIYKITVPNDETALVVSSIGMKTQTIPISGNTMNIVMQEDAKLLKDVVVTALGVKRQTGSLGYATTTVKGDDLNRTSDRSALNALQGKVAGVNITNSTGAPGGSSNVVIRGGSSLTGNNQALIVIDGQPIDNSYLGDTYGTNDLLNNSFDPGNRGNDINPQDIESVTVLKGAAATALYGSRASNGAIIYVTKSGKGKISTSGRPFKITYNTGMSINDILKLPTFQNKYGQGGGGVPDSRENWSWGPAFDGEIRPWGQEINGKQKIKPYVALPENVKSFFQTGYSLNNSISLEGSKNGSSFYFSYNNILNKGVIPTTGFDRNSIRFNFTQDFSEKLSASVNLNYSKTRQNLVTQGQGDNSVYNNVLQTPRDISFKELEDLTDSFNLPEYYYGAYTINPYWMLKNSGIKTNVDRFIGNVELNYKPFKWMHITGRAGNDYYTDSRYQYRRKYNYVNQDNEKADPGSYSENIFKVNEFNSDVIITLTKEFKKEIKLSGFIGNGVLSQSTRETYASTSGLAIDDFYSLSNSFDRPIVDNELSQRRIVGLYGGVDLNFKNYWFLSLTGRNDWSSTLPKSKNSYFYPSASTSFIVTEAFKSIPAKYLSYLKVRASVGQIGNDARPYFLTNIFAPGGVGDGFNLSELRSPYPSSSGELAPGYSVSGRLGNSNLKPEFTTSWEIGTEIGFLKDRVTMDITYYEKYHRNLITIIDVAPSSGYTSQIINAGNMYNKGVEIAAKVTPIVLKSGFKWEVYGTYTKNVNKVTKLYNDVERLTLGGLASMSVVAEVGQPYGSFYSETVKTTPDGKIIVDPATGAPLAADNPAILGSYMPKWQGSLGTTLSFKGLRFNILFDKRQGGKFYSRTKDVLEFCGATENTTNNNREDFVIPNSVVETSPGVYEENTQAVNHQDYWTNYAVQIQGNHLVSGSFVKLREMSLSYSLPASIFKNSKTITGLTVSFFGNNLALWTPKSNSFVDPETNSAGAGNIQGFEYVNTPSLRTYGFSAKVDF